MDPNRNPPNAKVLKWLEDGCYSCPSPHYSSDTERNYSDLFKLCDMLKSCPICKVEYTTPNDTLGCIKRHNKQLCYFCLKLMEIQEAENHYISSGHFNDVVRLTVNCPFQICDPDDTFKFPNGISHHIVQAHLPNSFVCTEDEYNNSEDEESELEEEAEKVELESEEECEVIECVNNNAKNAQSVTSNQENQDQSQHTIRNKIKNSVGTETPTSFNHSVPSPDPDLRGKNLDSQADDDLVFIKSVQNNEPKPKHSTPVFPTSTFFVCQFCEKLFTFRKALLNHSTKRKCSGLDNKRCFHCNFKFTGSTVLKCVIHLQECGEKYQNQQK